MASAGKDDARPVISKVDLRGVKLGSQEWEQARAAVFASMEAIGAVVVTHDALGADLRQALFGRAMPEFFALPLDVKRRLVSGAVNGYIERSARAGLTAYESVRIWETTDNVGGGGARNLSDGIWPHGCNNPAFSETIGTFAKNMMGLERTVATMILESLGVREDHAAVHHESVGHNVRLSHYGTRPETGPAAGVSMQVHRDCNVLTTIVQHEVEGLEMQVGDGSWVAVPPEQDAVAIVAGEMLTVATNGRVPACVHRVRTPSNRERLSAQFVSMPKDGVTVRALDELVDDDHPLQYGPCNFSEYVDFRFAGDGRKLSGGTLKAFCGYDLGEVRHDEH